MANKDYNFQYTPLTGRLPGNSFVKQTEQAINELAGIVNEGAAQVQVITNLANQANDNSEEALEKANEALETSGRVYITLPNLEDADDYFDSQLYYFANSYSANLPVQDTGFLEVKTNDTKTACEQVFIADDTGLCYFRHGIITATEVGDETVYSVTWETWSSALASEEYVRQEVNNGVNTANSYTDEQISAEETRTDNTYLSLSGGTMTGAIKGNPVTLTADDGNGNSADLVLNADGSATLDGRNIITSAITGNIISVGANVNLPANVTTELCRADVPADGTYLIIGYSDMTSAVTGTCYVMLGSDDPVAYAYRVVRYNGASGGGDNAVNLVNLRAGYHAILKGYSPSAVTMRGSLRMVRLA